MIDRNTIHEADALGFLRSMPDQSVDIVVTSPPYNTLSQGTTGSGMHKGNGWLKKAGSGYSTYSDDMPEPDYQAWLHSVVAECVRVSKGLVWVNHKTRYRDGKGIHPLSFLDFPVWSEVIWNRKISMALNARKFAPCHEYIFGFGVPHYWDDRSNKSMSVWDVPAMATDIEHPCPFPEVIPRRLIIASCPPDGIVLDPFMGSGTTALAAQNNRRHFIGCEISREYIEMAIARLAKPYTLPMLELEGQ
jgi:site-specific DNA-methyltransferase (adenine-specific)